MLNKILNNYPEENLLKADGFDDAIIGISHDFMEPRLVYSVVKCIDILMEEMTEEEAFDYFYYNVSGAYVGDQTPIWCHDNF